MKKKILILLIFFLLIIGVTAWFNVNWFNFASATVSGIDSYTKLLLHNNGVDTSKSHAITASGNAQIDTAQSYFGGASGLFDGTGDSASTTDSNDWNFGTGDFTVDFWVRFSSVTGGAFVEQFVGASDRWSFHMVDANTIRFIITDTNVETIDISKSWSPSTAIWYHVALVRNGNDFKIFIDGIQVGTTTTDTSSVPDFSAVLAIGRYYGGDSYFNGWLDELRVSKGVARWTANFTPPGRQYTSDSSTALLLHLNGTDAATAIDDASGGDESGNNKIVTYSGNAQIDTAQSYFGGASGLFDGTGDSASTTDSADWNFGTGNLTIDFWVRFNSVASNQTFITQWVSGNSFWNMQWNANELQFRYYSDPSWVISIDKAWIPSANTWYHIALIRNGNDWMWFVDGTQVGTTSTDTDSMPDLAAVLSIGSDGNAGNYLNGWIDELRISKGIARWTANFTPPASAYSTLKRLIIY